MTAAELKGCKVSEIEEPLSWGFRTGKISAENRELARKALRQLICQREPYHAPIDPAQWDLFLLEYIGLTQEEHQRLEEMICDLPVGLTGAYHMANQLIERSGSLYTRAAATTCIFRYLNNDPLSTDWEHEIYQVLIEMAQSGTRLARLSSLRGLLTTIPRMQAVRTIEEDVIRLCKRGCTPSREPRVKPSLRYLRREHTT